MRRPPLPAVLLPLLLAAASSCGSAPLAAKPAAPVMPVITALVVVKDLPVAVHAIGSVQASSVVGIRSQVTGILTQVHFKEGSDITKGQLLFTIDTRPLQEALNQADANLEKSRASSRQARANLARDQAQLEYAALDTKRYQELLKKGMASQDQTQQEITNEQALRATVDADQAAIDTSLADVKTNESTVENARVQLSYCTITSPITGRAGALTINEGNLVDANSSILVTINRLQPIYTTFSVPESYFNDLQNYSAHQALAVRATPNGDQAVPKDGVLDLIDNQVDAATGSIVLRATYPNDDLALWPGQFVSVDLVLTTQRQAMTVPSQAVQSGQHGQYVYIVKTDDTVEMRPVTVQRIAGVDAVISDGVHPGESVVTDGQLRLVSGSKINRISAGDVAASTLAAASK